MSTELGEMAGADFGCPSPAASTMVKMNQRVRKNGVESLRRVTSETRDRKSRMCP